MDELIVHHLKNDGIEICLDHIVFVINKSYADAFCDFVRQQKLNVSIKETFDADPKAQSVFNTNRTSTLKPPSNKLTI